MAFRNEISASFKLPRLVNIFFSIQDYVNLLIETKGPKNTYMNL